MQLCFVIVWTIVVFDVTATFEILIKFAEILSMDQLVLTFYYVFNFELKIIYTGLLEYPVNDY